MANRANDRHSELIEELAELPVNHFLNAVSESADKRGQRLDRFVADAVAADIQAHLAAAGYEARCSCGGGAKKDGKRGKIQRYRCRECGKRFTAFSGTMLEKTNYTWDVWLRVIQGMLAGEPVERTRQCLADDYKCEAVNWKTVWGMRAKAMHAASKVEPPKLRGVIQIDDTFFREDQKGSMFLENPLPSDIRATREPRYGRVPSALGIRGNEFATITTAVDGSGHCVCELLGSGPIPQDTMRGFVEGCCEDIAFACSDSDSTYVGVFKEMNVAHYVRPSKYLEILDANGYARGRGLGDDRKERNLAIMERLWELGQIDRIENRGRMTFAQFQKLKKDNRLSLGAANELHDELKLAFEKRTRGVSTRMLSLYVKWFQYVRNKRVDMGRAPASLKDAEGILVELVGTHANMTGAMMDEIRATPIAELVPGASGRYVHALWDGTEAVRRESGDAGFYFGNEDGVESFGKRQVLRAMSEAQLRALAKRAGIKEGYAKSRSELVSELETAEGIGDQLLVVAAQWSIGDDRGGEDPGCEEKGKYQYHLNRAVPRELPGVLTTVAEVSGRGNSVVFLDVETTGLDRTYDEVLSLAVVSGEGEVLYDQMFRPERRKSWKKAAKVNGITPAMVVGKPLLKTEKEKVEAVLAGADVIAGWNVGFDAAMLWANGVDVPVGDGRWIDLMPEFCRAWGEVKEGYRRQKREKLENAVKWLGLDQDGSWKRHTAVGDAGVLVGVWEWIRELQGEHWGYKAS